MHAEIQGCREAQPGSLDSKSWSDINTTQGTASRRGPAMPCDFVLFVYTEVPWRSLRPQHGRAEEMPDRPRRHNCSSSQAQLHPPHAAARIAAPVCVPRHRRHHHPAPAAASHVGSAGLCGGSATHRDKDRDTDNTRYRTTYTEVLGLLAVRAPAALYRRHLHNPAAARAARALGRALAL